MPLPPDFEKTLWASADQLWANTGLQPADYDVPILALIFLRFAEVKFAALEAELTKKAPRGGVKKGDYQGKGVPFLAPEARYSHLAELPENGDLGPAIDKAMELVEGDNQDLTGVLPRGYSKFTPQVLKGLLKSFATIPSSDDVGDLFGRVYEYFLGEFAKRNLQKGGEYFTPVSVVRLLVAVLEPYEGRVFDPTCGSGGMFVQSARFIAEHRKNPEEFSILGTEKVQKTLRLCRMNLAVHGLSGQVREANSYYDDPHGSVGTCDFVLANPPFNQNAVDRERIKAQGKRYPFGLPTTDNANYLWIQLFYSALSGGGRAGFVMANSASDARGSEMEIRKKLLETSAVDVIVSLSSNLFYTVTLPATLWFLDRGKPSDRRDTVLFIDARHIFRQVDRAHREMTEAQVEFLGNIVRLYRLAKAENLHESDALTREAFPEGRYRDVPGLCKAASRKDIAAQGFSLNPGRFVGVAEKVADDVDFKVKLEELNEALELLNAEARVLEAKIAENVAEILAS
jgi:type I restriction enzyme M protein